MDVWLIRPTRLTVKIFVRNNKDENIGYNFDINTRPDYAKLTSAIVFGLRKEKVRENLKPTVGKAMLYLIELLEK